MNFAGVDWVRLIINWFPMLLILGLWVIVFRYTRGGGIYGNQKRIADALERIANALEKRH